MAALVMARINSRRAHHQLANTKPCSAMNGRFTATATIIEEKLEQEDQEEETTETSASTTSSLSSAQKLKEEKRKARRKIRLSGQIRVQEIRHINNISEHEKESIWLSSIDYKIIKNMAKTTIFMMMAGERIDEDNPDFCSRGLEFRSKAGTKKRNLNKLRARSAVLNEQDLQRKEGFHNPQFIAMASMDESFDCREEARKRADEDEDAHAYDHILKMSILPFVDFAFPKNE